MGSSTHRSPRLAVSRGVIPRGRSDASARPRRMICCGAPSIRRRTSWAHNSPPLLHRFGRAAKRRNPDPFRVTSSAGPAGTPDSREPAGRLRRQHLGTVPPLSPLAHGAHRTSAVTCRPDRRFHGRGNHCRRSAPPCGRIDRRAGRHGRLPSRHGPLPRSEPRRAAALHADQAAASHPSRSQAAKRIAASAPQRPLAAQIRTIRELSCDSKDCSVPLCDLR